MHCYSNTQPAKIMWWKYYRQQSVKYSKRKKFTQKLNKKLEYYLKSHEFVVRFRSPCIHLYCVTNCYRQKFDAVEIDYMI